MKGDVDIRKINIIIVYVQMIQQCLKVLQKDYKKKSKHLASDSMTIKITATPDVKYSV